MGNAQKSLLKGICMGFACQLFQKGAFMEIFARNYMKSYDLDRKVMFSNHLPREGIESGGQFQQSFYRTA